MSFEISDGTKENIAAVEQFASNVLREGHLFGAGVFGGALSEGARQVKQDSLGTAERLGGSLVLGAALGYLQRGEGLGKLAVEAVAVGSTLSLAADIPAHWSEVCATAADTWSHPDHTQQNINELSNSLGRFAFDVVATSAATLAGCAATGYVGVNKSYIPEFTGKGYLPPGEHSATWNEFAERYGTNSHRNRLLGTFKAAAGEIRDAGGTKVYVGGSFVTAEARPRDVDGIWLSRETGKDWVPLTAKLMDLDTEGRTDLYADNEWMGGLRQGKDLIRFTDSGKRVGIVKLDLESLPDQL